MDERLDEILAMYEAASACGCCCDDDFCAYVEKTKTREKTDEAEHLPESAASRRGSVRHLFEHAFS
ncbi:hypothetical protein [Ruegeria profundi]|uniref:Uncharacterized protein n=1 Tax=Ruegeria profundi TaxID=1685378 RepID=A0A0X3TQL2_9RHOB|nr:hypothetical protein [Ruegeria profundi]KUJ77321.1 hypothetical protein AVO44_17115 [Ruegeria profundi]